MEKFFKWWFKKDILVPNGMWVLVFCILIPIETFPIIHISGILGSGLITLIGTNIK